MKPGFAILTGVAVLALMGSGQAMAASPAEDPTAMGTGYTAADAPLGSATELRIDLRGEVAPRCELTSRPAFNTNFDVNRRGDLQSAFGIDCNAPFNLRVRSDHGGLSSDDPAIGTVALVPYELSIDVGTDAGLRALGWCASDQLTEGGAGGCVYGAGEGWSSGDDTAINRRGALRLRWDGQAKADTPALGRYNDTIVIELEVRS